MAERSDSGRSRLNSLRRMLNPRSVAVIGGREAEKAIMQCEKIGYDGEIWPVNPNRKQLCGIDCFSSISELPAAPDAAFVAIPNTCSVDAVRELAAIGAGGVVCYASGFAEIGPKGAELQREMEEVLGDMALVGPNCYGVLNYLDGLALWPDEQGGRRCENGVAIIAQSGNISINLTMQRRAVPLAYVISTGNMAGIKSNEYIEAMLEDERVTAIGLYLEGIPDAAALSEAAISALKKHVPIVVLDAGRSKVGSEVTSTHSSSFTGEAQVNSTFYRTYGIIQVDTIPQFLETLKFMSIVGPLENRCVATISCSGGEAAIMADTVDRVGLYFAELTDEQTTILNEVLGEQVVVSNPLDYHTYIWGIPEMQRRCFHAMFTGYQAITVKALDFPSDGVCDPEQWHDTVAVIIDAAHEAQAKVAVVASLHENFPESVQLQFVEHGIAPMLGFQECFEAILHAADWFKRTTEFNQLTPLTRFERVTGATETLTEFASKKILSNYGLATIPGIETDNFDDAKEFADDFGYPVAVKISSSEIIHKTEAGAVVLNIADVDNLYWATAEGETPGERFLVETMAPPPELEIMIGVRFDERFGLVMVIAAGGIFTELINDYVTMFLPVEEHDLLDALYSTRFGKLMDGFRGYELDEDALIESIRSIESFAIDNADRLVEMDVNPLFVYAEGEGAIAVDAVIKMKNKGNDL